MTSPADQQRDVAATSPAVPDLGIPHLGACRHDSPLAKYIAGRRTNEHHVDEQDRGTHCPAPG